MSEPTVIFLPSGKRGIVNKGTTVLDAARQLSVDLDSVCGGRGICSKCQILPSFGDFSKFGIKSESSSLSHFNEVEMRYQEKRGLKTGRRLGCQVRILSDIVIDVPEESQLHRQVVRKEAEFHKIIMSPAIQLYYVEVQEPDIKIPSGDCERLQEALEAQWKIKNIHICLSVMQSIQNKLRDGNWTLTCAIFRNSQTKSNEVVEIWSGYFDGPIYGVALDLGSTTLAAHLCDLKTGEVTNSEGMMNPQIKYGEDLMSRVSYAMMNERGAEKMSVAIREGIDNLLSSLCKSSKIQKDTVLELVIVGNPIMHHLILGIDPTELGQAPFALSIADSISMKASDLDINLNNNTQLYILPCIAGHVGADAAAVVLSTSPEESLGTVLVIDVGTNAEILLGNKKGLLACSSPTGPAFEGAQISCGQRAAPGAIENVRIDPQSKIVIFKVIGSELWSNDKNFWPSVEQSGITGICGSGIIEAIAEMRLAGIVDESGLVGSNEQTGTNLCVSDGRTQAFILHKSKDGTKDIIVNNADIRAIQLAKAALFAGAKLLMDEMGVGRVDKIILAGAFGAHISPKHAMVLGMIPDCKLENVVSAGNAAGTGARIALLNQESRNKIELLVKNITKIETAMAEGFQGHFIAASNIPNSSEDFPELKKIISLPNVNFNNRTSKRTKRVQKNSSLDI